MLGLDPTIKPSWGTQLDLSHPLALGLGLCLPCWEDGGPVRDLIRDRRSTGSAIWTPTTGSLGSRDFSLSAADTPDLTLSGGIYTVACLIYLPTNLGSGQYFTPLARFSYTSEGFNTGWRLFLRNDSFPGWFFDVFNNNSFSGGYGALSYAPVPTAGFHLVVATGDGTTRRLYLDGVQVASTTVSPTPATGAATLDDTNSGGSVASLLLGMVWPNRCLTIGEIAEFALRPWSLFREPELAALIVSAPVTGTTATGSATFGPLTASASVTVSEPAASTASGSATFSDLTATGSAIADVPAAASATGSATFSTLSASAVATAGTPGDAVATALATFGLLTASATGTAGLPAGSTAAGAATFTNLTVTATGVVSDPGTVSVSGSATFGLLTASAAGTASLPAESTAAGAATFGSLLASALATSGVGALASVQFSPLTVTASATAAAASSAVGSGFATFRPLTLVSIATGGVLPNILQAIQERLDSIPAFMASLPGGYFTGPPDPRADDNPPYMVITRIGGSVLSYVTLAGDPGPYIQGPVKAAMQDVFQVTLVGQDFDVLDQIHDLWEDHFHPRMDPLLLRRKMFKGLFNQEPSYDFGDAPADPQGYNVCVYRWEFTILTTAWER